MKLATRATGSLDGSLIVVSTDLSHAAPAAHIAPDMLRAIERWDEVAGALQDLSRAVAAGTAPGLHALDQQTLAAPLPRTWQWLDGSVFRTHIDLSIQAYKVADVWYEHPLMYQGMSHQFLGPRAEVHLPSVADGIDFEGEFAVVTGPVPMSTDPATAAAAILLVTQINDWSLRVQGRDEMVRGYGWVHAKPACTMAPVLVTPDELGAAWRDNRCHLDLRIDRNGEQFGNANGGEMGFGFDELIAHAAYSRQLAAGTVIGSGTVANAKYRDVGSSCILERRAIEMIETGAVQTSFLENGERVRMVALDANGGEPLGAMDSLVRVNKS